MALTVIEASKVENIKAVEKGDYHDSGLYWLDDPKRPGLHRKQKRENKQVPVTAEDGALHDGILWRFVLWSVLEAEIESAGYSRNEAANSKPDTDKNPADKDEDND